MAKLAKTSEPVPAMDYAEHEKTYANFLWLTKWTVVGHVILLIAMALGFFGGFGLVGGTLVFLVLTAIAYFLI